MITEPIALDKSLNTTGTSSKNIADVVQKGLNDIRNAIEGGSGGGGHIIVDQSGAEMPQEPNMTFKDAHLTDNPTGESTDIEIVKEVLPADYASTTDEGIIVCDDGEDAVIHPSSDDYVEVTADGEKTYAQLLTELKELIDKTKLQYYSTIVLDKQTSVEIHNVVYWDTNVVATACVFTTYGGVTETDTFYIGNNVKYQKNIVGNVTDMSSEKPSNGTKITLYYGNKKAVVDLQTTANRCLLNSGETVESALTITKTQFTPKVGASSSFATRNFYVTDNRTFLEVHFCLVSTTSIAAYSEIMDLPTIAQNKIFQYCIAAENKSGNAYVVSNNNTALVLGTATTAQNGNYLFGTFRMSLLA